MQGMQIRFISIYTNTKWLHTEKSICMQGASYIYPQDMHIYAFAIKIYESIIIFMNRFYAGTFNNFIGSKGDIARSLHFCRNLFIAVSPFEFVIL